jgi:amino acid adenylation domain-containing protein
MADLLHQLLTSSAAADPARPAVVDGDRTITYGELDRASNQLARFLIEIGVQRGDRVGVYLEKSIGSVIGIYAALKAGAVYVPVDPYAPVLRVAYILDNCGVNVVLTGAEKRETWPGVVDAAGSVRSFVALNADAVAIGDGSGASRPFQVHSWAEVEERDDGPVHRPTIELDLAYILYTSGSTGDPKGVKLTHLNAMTFVRWVTTLLRVGPEDRLSSHAPFHFDLSILDLFAAASGGATVVLVPPDASVFPRRLRDFIESSAITIWYSVPSILNMLVLRGDLAPGVFPSLRWVLFAGEVFPTKYLRRLMQAVPGAAFANLYGPTETNVCTAYVVPEIPDDDAEPVPIGSAIAGVEVVALTDDGTEAAPGAPGELFVRGCTVMQGYWGDADRTARAIVRHPFDPELVDPVYRTGDLVVRGQDGEYRLIGRRDSQIKSRGYRIELGDIEAALYSHQGVIECAVVAFPDEMVTNRIRAFVAVQDGITGDDLQRFCSDRIPRYMVPESFAIMESLPKTSTGKIDKRALTSEAEAEPPASALPSTVRSEA